MRKIGHWFKARRNYIFYVVLMLVLLATTSSLSYKAGQRHASSGQKTKLSTSLFNKDVLKNLPKKTNSNQPAATSQSTSSSGFFRLSGTITSVKKDTIAIKLGEGTVVTLSIGKDAKFYTGTPRAAKPVTELKAGTAATVIGTIAPAGTFTASNIQAQK